MMDITMIVQIKNVNNATQIAKHAHHMIIVHHG